MGEQRDADVAIVGGGLAGLTTALRLAGEGISAIVLEARDRVGGRTVNQGIGDGKVVEMGGQWIGPTQDRVYALADELGVGTFPSYEDGDEILLLDGKRYRFGGQFPRINPLVIADLMQLVLRLDRLAARVPPERPWEAPCARDLDGQTVETWLKRTAKTRRARSILGFYLSAILAAEPKSISMLHAAFYVRSATNFEVMSTFSGGAQQDRILGGSQALSIALAERLGDAVALGTPVRRITQSGAGVHVEADGSAVSARRVVIATPPALTARIEIEPPLPADRAMLLQRMPQGQIIKVNAIYDEPFWRKDGLKGLGWSPERPVSIAVDNSPPDGSPGILAAFVKGDHARRLGRMEPDARRKLVLDCLVEYHGPRAGTPDAYFELDWSAEPWTRGCYGAHFPPGVWTQYGPVLREPVGSIHWAGTETSPVWNGYMEGAIRSGERAAREVLATLG